jgi:prolyl-tRNA editing enzyme YbaK/EbsC (Cys-tRNA(Pro) deacylase)
MRTGPGALIPFESTTYAMLPVSSPGVQCRESPFDRGSRPAGSRRAPTRRYHRGFSNVSTVAMKQATHPTALRTERLLREAGVDTRVVEFEQPTRTSAEAAAAIGCSVGEIAKSIVFRGVRSGQAVVVVASGENRVDEKKVSALVDEPLARADADFVREATGYAIGGVAPIGHARAPRLLLDQDLRRFETIWAAAGTPFSVFPLTPQQLRTLTGADWTDVRQ